MRKYFWLLAFLSVICNGQSNRYFSTSGDDGGAGTEGDPWLHPYGHSYSSGDVLYFKRGEVWDTVHLTSHFVNDDNILITDYGTADAAPILSGALEINSFVNLSGNIWYYVVDLGSFPRGGQIYTPNGITVDHKWVPPAQTDSVMMYDYTGCDLTTVELKHVSFSTNELANAYIAVQTHKWKWSTVPIASNTSTTITTSTSMIENPAHSGKDLYCKLWMLDSYMDSENEWTYDGDTLKIYSTTNPNTAKNVRLCLIDTITLNNGGDNFRIKDVVIEQANHIGFQSSYGTGAYCDTVQFNAVSGYGAHFHRTDTAGVYNSSFVDMLCHGIQLDKGDSALIQGNYFKRVGYLEGLDNRDFDGGGFSAIRSEALEENGSETYQYNYMDSVGLGFQLYSSRNYTTKIAQYNYINNYGLNRSDNGAIYWASEAWTVGVYRMTKNNFILNNNLRSKIINYLPLIN